MRDHRTYVKCGRCLRKMEAGTHCALCGWPYNPTKKEPSMSNTSSFTAFSNWLRGRAVAVPRNASDQTTHLQDAYCAGWDARTRATYAALKEMKPDAAVCGIPIEELAEIARLHDELQSNEVYADLLKEREAEREVAKAEADLNRAKRKLMGHRRAQAFRRGVHVLKPSQ